MNPDFINSLTNNKNKQFYLFALLFAALSVVSPFIPATGLILLATGATIYKFGKESLLYVVVFLYFIITSDFSESLRLALNYGSLLILGVLYLWEFGITFPAVKQIPTQLILLVFYTLTSMTISMLGSEDPMKGSILIVKQILFFFIVYVIYSFLRSDKVLFNWMRLIIITSTVLAFSLLYDTGQLLLSASSLVEVGVIRTSGLYGNANAIALFFVVSIPIMIVMAIENKSEKGKYGYYPFLIALNFLALVLTNSRASFLGVMVSVFYLIFHYKKTLFFRTLYVGMGLLLIVLLIDPLREFFLMAIRYERVFENIRGYYWQIAAEIISDNPIFGVGPGLFEDNIYRYLPVQMNSFDEFQLHWARSGTTHNFILYRFSEYGIFGVINAVFFIFIIFNFSGKILSNIGIKNNYRYIVYGIRGLSFGFMARSLFETSGILTNGWITRDLPFWLAFILLTYIYEQTSKPERASL
ncbi:MAG: hypothetical protein SCALA702_25470 [Melioribacteraceae bacterium]|nr:MAG: hypothetical protein SCALA702_25470 [Melioribacteraceae bacterium]